MNIRLANHNDIPALSMLRKRTFSETYTAYNTPADMEHYLHTFFDESELLKELNDKNVIMLVVESEGDLCAYTKLSLGNTPECVKHKPSLMISSIYVLQKYFGTGLGLQLIDKAVEYARKYSCQSLVLAVWKENKRAIRFYEKTGFLVAGETTFDWGTGKIDEDWWMEKSI